MDLGSIVAHLKLQTKDFMNGVRDAVQGVNQIEDSLQDLNRAGDSIRNMGSQINSAFNNMGAGGTKLNRQLEQLAYQLGGEVPEATKEAYKKQYELNQEIKRAERGYGKYSTQAMDARNALSKWALGLDDTTFKQVYMRSQLGQTEAQIQQQANSIKLNARMTKLMGNETEVLTQHYRKLQDIGGITPEMMIPRSTLGVFQRLNETVKDSHSPLTMLSSGYRALGTRLEGTIKKFSLQKIALRDANGDLAKYQLSLRNMQMKMQDVMMALPLMGLAAVAAYKSMFKSALEADKGLAKLADTTKGKLAKAFEPVIDAAGKFLEITFKVVGAVADWIIKFNEAHPVIAKVAGAIAFLLPALTTLMIPLALGKSLLTGWMAVLNQVWTLIGGVASVMGMASSTALVLTGIIGALAVAFIALWKNSETFRDICTNVWNTVKTKVSEAITAITGYIDKLKNAFETGGIKGVLETLKNDINTLVQNIIEKAPQMLEAGIQMIENFCNAITQNLPQIMERGREIISNILTGLAEKMPEIINKAVEIISMFAENWLANISTFLTLGIELITALIQGLAEALPEIVTTAVTIITELISTFVELLPQIIEVGVELLLALIDGLIEALPGLIDAGIKAIDTLVNAILDNLPEILDAAVEIILALLDGLIQALPQLLEAGFKIIVILVEAIITHLPDIIAASWEIIKALVKGLNDLKTSLFNAGKELMSKLIQVIIEKCVELATKTAEKFNELKVKCTQKIDELKAQAGNKFNELKTSVVNKVNEIKQNVVNKFNELKTNAINKLNEMKTNAINKVTEMKNNFVNKITEMKTNAVNKIKDVASGIVNGLKDLPGKLRQAAKDAVQGLINGLNDKLQAVKKKAKEIADKVKEALTNALKIKSPSRVMRDEVGKFIPEGIAVGMDMNADSAINSAKNLASNLVSSVDLKPLQATVSSTGIKSTTGNTRSNTMSVGEQALLNQLRVMTGLLEDTSDMSGLNVVIEEFNNNTEEDVNSLMQRMEAQIRLNQLGKGLR